MFHWITRKLKARRIAMSIAQLEHELKVMPPAEIAIALVRAIEFSSSFAIEANKKISTEQAIGLPNSLNSEDAYALYWNLEGILMECQHKNAQAYARTKERLNSKLANGFRNDMKIIEVGLRLLLSRIAATIDRENKPKLQVIAHRLDQGVPLIGDAIKSIKLQHLAIGTLKPEEHYSNLEAGARLYAFSYMASFYGPVEPKN